MTIGKGSGAASLVFRLDPGSGVPTYLQLVQQVEQAIRLGQLTFGDQLPTVKDVVGTLAINPNTVLKAYRELEHRGLAVGRRARARSSRARCARSAWPSRPRCGAAWSPGCAPPTRPAWTPTASPPCSAARCGTTWTAAERSRDRPGPRGWSPGLSPGGWAGATAGSGRCASATWPCPPATWPRWSAGRVDDLLATHRVLTGPADALAACDGLSPVRVLRTGTQVCAVVRGSRPGRPLVCDDCEVHPIGLEELVLAYLREPGANALPGPETAVAGGRP